MTLSKTHAWCLALTATLTMTVSYLDRQTLAVLAPTITAEFSLSEGQYGTLLSAFSIAYLLGTPLAGRLLDRVGVRRALPVSLLLWTLVAAAHALIPPSSPASLPGAVSSSFVVLLGLRALLGLAESPSFPGAAQAIQRVLPPGDRARGLGILFTGSSFGAMVAPKLATALLPSFGWRGAFVGSALIGLAWLPLWFGLSSGEKAREALDRPGDMHGGADQNATPTTPLSLLSNAAVLRAMAVVVAAAPAISFALLWGSKYLVAVHGVPQTKVGNYLWLPPLLYDLGSIAFGDLASRRIARGDISPARVLVIASALLMLLLALTPLGGSAWGSLAWMSLALAGGGGLYAVATADMLARVPSSAVATASGIVAATQSLTYIVLNPLFGRFLDHGGTYDTLLVALGLWALPGSLVWLLWSPPRPAATTLASDQGESMTATSPFTDSPPVRQKLTTLRALPTVTCCEK